jgi:hypothetical protein
VLHAGPARKSMDDRAHRGVTLLKIFRALPGVRSDSRRQAGRGIPHQSAGMTQRMKTRAMLASHAASRQRYMQGETQLPVDELPAATLRRLPSRLVSSRSAAETSAAVLPHTTRQSP